MTEILPNFPSVTGRGDTLPPLFIFQYPYAAKSEREFCKKYHSLKNQTTLFMLRFNQSGFNTEKIFLEYIANIIQPWKTQQSVDITLVMDEAPCHLTQPIMEALKKAKICQLLSLEALLACYNPLTSL